MVILFWLLLYINLRGVVVGGVDEGEDVDSGGVAGRDDDVVVVSCGGVGSSLVVCEIGIVVSGCVSGVVSCESFFMDIGELVGRDRASESVVGDVLSTVVVFDCSSKSSP